MDWFNLFSIVLPKHLVKLLFFFRNVNHKTCPICRAKVDNSDDTWVLTEKPDQNEMAYETTGYLMGLADRTGTPSHSPTD